MLSYLDHVFVLGYQKSKVLLLNPEYVSASKDTSQAIRLRRIFEDIDEEQKRGIVLYCDNK